jgi:hypothetical protein
MIEEKSLLFFEKKRSKKNFDSRVRGTARANTARSGAKVFWFFFSKKNVFLFSGVRP